MFYIFTTLEDFAWRSRHHTLQCCNKIF